MLVQIRTICYGSQLVGGVLSQKTPPGRPSSSDLGNRLLLFSAQLSHCRTVLRLFDDLSMLAYSRSYGLGPEVSFRKPCPQSCSESIYFVTCSLVPCSVILSSAWVLLQVKAVVQCRVIFAALGPTSTRYLNLYLTCSSIIDLYLQKLWTKVSITAFEKVATKSLCLNLLYFYRKYFFNNMVYIYLVSNDQASNVTSDGLVHPARGRTAACAGSRC